MFNRYLLLYPKKRPWQYWPLLSCHGSNQSNRNGILQAYLTLFLIQQCKADRNIFILHNTNRANRMRQICPFLTRFQSCSLLPKPSHSLAPLLAPSTLNHLHSWVCHSLCLWAQGTQGCFCLEHPLEPILAPAPTPILFCDHTTSSRKP